jgi:hypothetical protein
MSEEVQSSIRILMIISILLIIIYMGYILMNPYESYEKPEKIDDDKLFTTIKFNNILNNDSTNPNPSYITGSYFLTPGEEQYDEYNAYKQNPSQQPINAPHIDYINHSPSTLPEQNIMFAKPAANETYVNLLNNISRQ